jgi:2-iminobutanoate/2-iminopropanoate deaminase
MANQVINTTNAPAPIGHYSQAVKAGNVIFISGQVALVPGSDQFITDNIAAETQQVMKNLKAILDEAGLTFQNVVKTTIFLSDMSLFSAVNEVYGQYFVSSGDAPAVYPARETVAVKGLPKNANVEISMIAAI